MEMRLADNNAIKLVDTFTGEEMLWNVSIYERTRLNSVENLFRDINGYWSRVPENRLRVIWAIYQEIRNIFDEVFDFNQLNSMLTDAVYRLYEQMPMDEIEHWIKFYGKVKYPDKLDIEHDPHDTKPARTYLRSEYHGLVVLTVGLRPMVPIWGEYMARIRSDTSNTFKEYAAMKLLSRTYMLANQYTERLRLYIDAFVDAPNKSKLEDNSAAVLAGLGSDELPDWMLAFVSVKRMAVVEIDAHETRGSIISNIYGYISHAIDDLDRKFDGTIKEKRPMESSKGEDEISQLESYRVKHEVSYGEIASFSVYVRNVLKITHDIDPTVPPELVERCLSYALPLIELPITKHHIVLTQWLTSTVLPPRAIRTLHKIDVLRMMAAAQALLYHWGFDELAVFVTAQPFEGSANPSILMETKHRLTAETIMALNALYPYTDVNDKDNTKKSNYAIRDITTFHKEINMIQWIVNVPRDMATRCPHIYEQPSFRVMAFSPNALETIAKLVIFLNTRQQEIA